MASSDRPARLHAWVSGRVQGVFFRMFVHREATGLALQGLVRNLLDGRVEVIAEGDRPCLDRLVERLRCGPSGASVRAVEIEWEDAEGGLRDFRVEYL